MYRIRYWSWINEHFGEWVLTGMMSRKSAEIVADTLRRYHERVEMVPDDDGKMVDGVPRG